MALIVEDGSIVAGAESYITVAEATQYHADRGNTAWAALTLAVQEQLLRKAAQYMLEAYRYRWAGFRRLATQALDWPRSYVPLPDTVSGYGANTAMVSPSIVPTEVKQACAELALRAATQDLLPDLTQQILREKVGPIETQYDPHSPQVPRWAAVDALLRPYLARGSNSARLVRA